MEQDKLLITTKFKDDNLNKVLLSVSEEDKNSLILASEEELSDGENFSNISNKSIDKILKEQSNLKKDDLVIHIERGLGRFIGLETIEFDDIKNDFLKIEYANNTNLLIPIENIDLITKYSEPNILVKLDSLGSSKWSERKAKIRQKIKDISNDLIRIASKRKLLKAPIISRKNGEYEEFINLCDFELTSDQTRSLQQIEDDFQKGIPMDRLLCGDVGYGKTEVAIRTAFMVASNGYQVAIIAPTTLLSNQHYKKFLERFKGTGLNVACLSRINTQKQSNEIKKSLENGNVDIVIGTHALLNKEIKYKNLGLVIVDEEQRFGVKQKEKLKDLRLNAHILSMSATPIPRTLQMSMSGIKDLSIIATAPKNRINVKTKNIIYDDTVIKEIIDFELQRKGKIFFVVPRIQDIKEVLVRLEKTIPYLKYVVIHGQMDAKESERLMNDFFDGKYSMLISTSIIENGIDIAEANAMIIYRANNFGLAQLYQLRGRVGRSNVQAYAYLTTKKTEAISGTAKKRLEVMASIDGLNAGFKIASEDMELRGTGNVVGTEQSGHIKDIGIELYNQMLKEAINNNKDDLNENEDFDYSPEIKLGLSTIISNNYIENPVIKMSFYRRIADIETLEDKKILEDEMKRRFGDLEESVKNLLEISILKAECKKLNIQKLEKKGENILVSFFRNKCKKPQELIDYILKHNNEFKLNNNSILYLDCKKENIIRRCDNIINILKKI